MQRTDLIVHPARLRILQALSQESLTTREVAERLPDVPESSIYRHLRLLLEGELIAVASTRLVRGIPEKRYSLAGPALVSQAELTGMKAEDHLHYFTLYVLSLLRGFADYVERAGARDAAIDFEADRVGYTEVAFFATPEELDALGMAINTAINGLRGNRRGDDRLKHKLAIVTHPVPAQ